jgi:hypothetical protein
MTTRKDFEQMRKDVDGQRVYDTTVGTYTIDQEKDGAGLVVCFSPSKPSGLFIVTETLQSVPVQCCLHHAYINAEAFCYGNMMAWMADTPNPNSPWAGGA